MSNPVQVNSDDGFITLPDILHFLRRRWKSILIPSLVVMAATWSTLVTVPKTALRASATISIMADPFPDLKRNLTPQFFLRIAAAEVMDTKLREESARSGISTKDAPFRLSAQLVAPAEPVATAGLEFSVTAFAPQNPREILLLWIRLYQEECARAVTTANSEASTDLETQLTVVNKLMAEYRANQASISSEFAKQKAMLSSRSALPAPEGQHSRVSVPYSENRPFLASDEGEVRLHALQESYATLLAKRLDLTLELPTLTRRLEKIREELQALPKEGPGHLEVAKRFQDLQLQTQIAQDQIAQLDQNAQRCMAQITTEFTQRATDFADAEREKSVLQQKFANEFRTADQAIAMTQAISDRLTQSRINSTIAKGRGLKDLLLITLPAKLPLTQEPPKIMSYVVLAGLATLLAAIVITIWKEALGQRLNGAGQLHEKSPDQTSQI